MRKSCVRIMMGIAATMLAPAAAEAVCGLQTVSGGTQTVTYDPFNPNAVTFNTTQLQLHRINVQGGNRTQNHQFLFL